MLILICLSEALFVYCHTLPDFTSTALFQAQFCTIVEHWHAFDIIIRNVNMVGKHFPCPRVSKGSENGSVWIIFNPYWVKPKNGMDWSLLTNNTLNCYIQKSLIISQAIVFETMFNISLFIIYQKVGGLIETILTHLRKLSLFGHYIFTPRH